MKKKKIVQQFIQTAQKIAIKVKLVETGWEFFFSLLLMCGFSATGGEQKTVWK